MSPAPLNGPGPALAAFELATVARGVVVLDQMAKRAETSIVAARTLSPGRYLLVLSAPVAEIEEAMDAAEAAAGEDRVDAVILRVPADELLAALGQRLEPRFEESLLIVETSTISSLLLAADRALKEAEVHLVELRLGAGLSGKGVMTLTGPLHFVEAARDVIEEAVPEARRVRIELISQPHPDLPMYLLEAEPAAPRGPKGR